MPRLHIPHLAAFTFAAVALVAAPAVRADVTLYSSDGRWRATIEDAGGAAGQCNGQAEWTIVTGYRQFLANTRHYIRKGTAISYASAVSSPMQDEFHLLSFANSGDNYTAVLASDDVAGLIAIVHGEMISGDAGGLRVSLTFADMDPSPLVLGQYSVKPFVYANMNVDNQMLSNIGGWSVDHFHQSYQGGSAVRWFRGRNSLHHSSKFNSTMQQILDTGVQELDDFTVGGPGDINTAMSFGAVGLGPAETHTVAYAIGNENISIPAGFGLTPNVGAVAVTSPDSRWSATIRTGVGHLDYGSAGEITAAYDFAEPVGQSQFAVLGTYFLGISQNTVFSGQPFKDAFRRVALFYPSDSPNMFSAVLNHKDYPGLIMILDGKSVSGEDGGFIMCMKIADTLGRDLNIAAAAYADMDVYGETMNVGGKGGDYFWQSPTGTPHIKWFRPASYGSYFSNPQSNLMTLMNLGLVTLPNTVYGGPGNIATAFGFESWPLQGDEPYVTGFALGNPDIVIPPDFVWPSAWFTCAADISPAPSGDGVVNVNDLLEVINNWGPCPTGCDADIVPSFVGDGSVNVNDLLEVINNWGVCFPK